MTALANTASYQSTRSSVTSISVNSRVDYILRFSKQAVLVVDEQESLLSQVASHFLTTLSESRNAAFISVSPKHNDIQLRCRIIEQLFGGHLFDPEQSLAVSVINQVKKSQESISIVVEQAQSLSLQLMYELCQLAEIAKKSSLNIDVLMLGNAQAGAIAAQSKGLFSKKVSIVNASNGQLISLNAAMFNQHYFSLNKKNIMKLISGFTLISIVLAATVIWLDQQDLLSFAAQPQHSVTLAKEEGFVGAANITKPELPLASPSDILNAITLDPDRFNLRKRNTEKTVDSMPTDTTLQLAQAVQKEVVNPSTENMTTDTMTGSSNDSKKSKELDVKQALPNASIASRAINSQYYLGYQSGYTIQLGGFAQNAIFNEFKAAYPDLKFYGYERSLHGSRFIVVTSQVYKTKAHAETAFALLPKSILAKGPWIKSVPAINKEIKQYQQTE